MGNMVGNMEAVTVRETGNGKHHVSRHDEIRKLLEEGRTVREICETLRVSPKTVCRVRKELGLTTRTGTGRVRAERRKEERKEGEERKREGEELKRRIEALEEALKRKEEELKEKRTALERAEREIERLESYKWELWELEDSLTFWRILGVVEAVIIVGLCVWLRVWTWV